MTDIKEIIRVLGFIQEYFDNHADEQEPDARKELFRDWSEITLDAITLLKAREPVEPTRKPEIFDSLYFCGKCSTKVGFQMRKDDSWRFKCKFCPNCGQAVKWE